MKTHKNIIVTLMHNKAWLTQQLVEGLSFYEKENIDRLIVVDNGSDALEIDKLTETPIDFPATISSTNTNLGFTLGANFGLYEADMISQNSLVFLISNDVKINGPFINRSEEILLGKRCLLGNRHITWDTGWNTFGGKVFDYLEGYFLAASSKTWRELDYFDHLYAPCDMEDVDLSTKAKSDGCKLVSLNNPNIVHLGAATYGYTPEREAITKRNKKYFEEKWTGNG